MRVRKRQIGRKEKDRGEQEEGDKRRKTDTWQEKYKEGKEEEDRKKKYRKKVEDGDGQHSTRGIEKKEEEKDRGKVEEKDRVKDE